MLTAFFWYVSLSLRSRLHQHPTRTGRRPEPLRASEREVEPYTERGEDPHQCDEYACGAE